MTLQIDTLAYTNRLRDWAPEMKLRLAIALLTLAFIGRAPVQLAIVVWMAIWTIVHARIPAQIYFKMIGSASIFLLMSLPALIVNITSSNPSAGMAADSCLGIAIAHGHLYISCTGIEQALTILLRATASVSCLFFVFLTVPVVQILEILRRCGCPVILTELLLLMYRFIFVLLETASQLWIAQEARNGHRTWSITMRSLGQLIGQLLHSTLERYRQYSLTLASRGFSGEFPVLQQRHYRLSRRYSLEAIVGCVVLLGLAVWK